MVCLFQTIRQQGYQHQATNLAQIWADIPRQTQALELKMFVNI